MEPTRASDGHSERMEIDDEVISLRETPPLLRTASRTSSQQHPTPLLPRIQPAEPVSQPIEQYRHREPEAHYDRQFHYDERHSYPLPQSPPHVSSYYSRSSDRHARQSYPAYESYYERRHDPRYRPDHRNYHQEYLPRDSHRPFPSDVQGYIPPIGYSPIRRHVRPRDRSPGSPYHRRDRTYPPPRHDRRDFAEHPPPSLHEDNIRDRAGPPEWNDEYPRDSRGVALEDYVDADRYSGGRYTRYEPEVHFTFAHRSDSRMQLPPAREMIHESPELSQSASRRSAEQINRRHTFGEPIERRLTPQAAEDILESMNGPQPVPRMNHRGSFEDRVARDRNADLTAVEHQAATMPIADLPATTQRSQGATSVQQRTGFPNSGLRSTAPPTPPNPRTSSTDAVTFPPRFPGPSLGPLPIPRWSNPPNRESSHSQPTLSTTSRPRIERSKTTPTSIPTETKRKPSVRKTILDATQREDPPKQSRTTSRPSSSSSTQGLTRAKSPSRQILELSLPAFLPDLPLSNSARTLLLPPPWRDDPPKRTKDQDRAYAEWLFDSSTNVQRCMTRAVETSLINPLKGVDELLFITHWIVKYLHQLGLSYFSRLRHEMRVAFWWKVNWSWFCVIKVSYDEAIKSISEEEIRPFPDKDAIRGNLRDEGSIGPVKKEDEGSPTQRSSDQDTISEPMEDVIASQSDVPQNLRQYWDLAKKINTRSQWPRYLGEDEWFEIGNVLVDLGHELAKYGLLDMELGLWENEILHRIAGVMKAWRERETEMMRLANVEFKKLTAEEQRIMVAAVRDDEKGLAGKE